MSYLASPAGSGFAGRHTAEMFSRFMGSNPVSNFLDTRLANALAGPGAPLMPLLGTSAGMSRYGASQAMARQAQSLPFAAEIANTNPSVMDLFSQHHEGLGPVAGPIASGLLDGFFGDRKGAYNTVLGTMHDSFGSDVRSRAAGAFDFTAAMHGGLLDGVRTDFARTHGMSFSDVAGSVARASRMNMFGVGRDRVDEIMALASRGDTLGQEGAQVLAGGMASEIAGLVAAGRDVFGAGASIEEIAAGVSQTFGQGGLRDAASATASLRAIDSASQVLDLDQETIRNYAEMMRKVAENSGAADSSLSGRVAFSMMARTEGAVLSASESGIQLDRNRVAADMASDSKIFGGSHLNRQAIAAQNVLDRMGASELVGETLQVDGTTMTYAEVKAQMSEAARVLNDPDADPERKARAMAKSEKMVQAMGGDARVSQVMEDWDTNRELEEAIQAMRHERDGGDLAAAMAESGIYSGAIDLLEDIDAGQMGVFRALASRGALSGFAHGNDRGSIEAIRRIAMEEKGMSEADAGTYALKVAQGIRDADAAGGDVAGVARAINSLYGPKDHEERIRDEIESGVELRGVMSEVFGEAYSMDMKTLVDKVAGDANEILKSEDKGAALKKVLGDKKGQGRMVLGAALVQGDAERVGRMMEDLEGADSDEDRRGVVRGHVEKAAEEAAEVVRDADKEGMKGILSALDKVSKASSDGYEPGKTRGIKERFTNLPEGDGEGGGFFEGPSMERFVKAADAVIEIAAGLNRLTGGT